MLTSIPAPSSRPEPPAAAERVLRGLAHRREACVTQVVREARALADYARLEPDETDDLAATVREGLDAILEAIAQKRSQQEALTKESGAYRANLASTPEVEQEYAELSREQEAAAQNYARLEGNFTQAKMTTDLQKRQQGMTFNLMDQANLPDSPIYPKKPVFILGGLVAGLGLGLLITVLLEYKDTTLRSERDVWAFTQLPTLAVIAWSGDIAQKVETPKKRLFGRKSAKELLANNPG